MQQLYFSNVAVHDKSIIFEIIVATKTQNKMPQYDSIRIKPKTKSAISQLSKKFEMTQVKFLDAVMQYLQETGVNPKDFVVLSPAEEIKKLRDTVVSFMRKQEKDFILPVFGHMETLIVRFMQYIEEEAPKNTDVKKASSFKTLEGSEKKIETQEEEKFKIETSNSGSRDLLNELEREKLKTKSIKEHLSKVLDNIEVKTTGLTKKPVLELPMAEINSIKEFVKSI